MARTVRALDSDGYDRWCTVTLTPSDWRQGMARLAHKIRREVGAWEWTWVRERGPKTGMLHAHALVRGPFLKHKRLSKLAVEAGFGKIAHIGVGSGHGAYYAAKIGAYVGKAQGGWDETLALNGDRPWHWSRGYTRGETVRDFVQRAAPARDPGPWEHVAWWTFPEGRAWVEAWPRFREQWALEALATAQPAIDEHNAFERVLDVFGEQVRPDGSGGRPPPEQRTRRSSDLGPGRLRRSGREAQAE